MEAKWNSSSDIWNNILKSAELRFSFGTELFAGNLNWKAQLGAISTKFSKAIGLLHKLLLFPKQVLHSKYNSLIISHINYSLLAWGLKSHKIELLRKNAIRVLYSKSPIAHTEPVYKDEPAQTI